MHELGLEIRCGVHTGECEVVDGELRGIAVHIGARVMSLANAAEVLVTGTVRDLMVGSGIQVEEHGTHTLKGVDGVWSIYRVTAIDDKALPPPLAADEAVARIVTLGLSARRSTRRVAIELIAAAVLGAGNRGRGTAADVRAEQPVNASQPGHDQPRPHQPVHQTVYRTCYATATWPPASSPVFVRGPGRFSNGSNASCWSYARAEPAVSSGGSG